MYLFGETGIVTDWIGIVNIRYRWPIIRDALGYLVKAIRGFHIAGLYRA